MRNILLIFLVAGLCPAIAQQTARSIGSSGASIGYLEHLPPGYQTGNQKYPVLIYLHGSGESGSGSAEDLELVKIFGPPSHIEEGHNMCFTVNGKNECFIVIAPQITITQTWRDIVPLVVQHILNGPDHYRIDINRIYLTGMSRGGYGVYSHASSPQNGPNKLAAIAPIGAWAENYGDGCIISERKIPVWAFHGGLDTTVTLDRGLNAFNSIKDCTDPEPDADLVFTIYENRFHNVWTPAYEPSHVQENPNLYEWLLMHTLNGNPPDPGPGEPEPEDPVTSVTEDAIHFFSIHPNPARNDLYLSPGDQFANSSITIVNMTGEQIMKTPAVDHLDISGLHSGVYFVQMTTTSGKVATERLVKIN